MRRLVNNIISVFYSAIRLLFLKLFNRGIHAPLIQRISPNVVLEIDKGGALILGESVRIHSGSKVKVRRNGRCSIGNNVRVNYGCMLFCHKSIIVEEGTEFGPNVIIYDHDHDFRSKGGLKAGMFKESPVHIGKNCWIGANCIILRGTEIGDNSVIAAGCVVKGKVAPNTILIQKRENSLTFYDGNGNEKGS